MCIDYRGRRATIMGLGRFGGGAAAARWLVRQGARVTISDKADESTLAESLRQLADAPIDAVRLGGHREEDFRGADLVVVNPAVKPNSPWLEVARRSRARLIGEIELLMENCPARIIGVTGSNGKSTTAAMIAEILAASGRRTFLGGNIGGSLLERLSEIGRDDWVVLELSSFQLWHLSPAARMPHVAVITGCTPNHLDWHGNFAEYAAAKQRILSGQTTDDLAVLNVADAEVAAWRRLVRGRLIEVSSPLSSLPPLPVPGEHNRINAALAAAAAGAIGCSSEDIRRGLSQFRGLPQRLELVAEIDGRRFYNDSSATTPESTVAALRANEPPVWLLAGGTAKGCNFGPMIDAVVARASGAAFFGASAEELHAKTKRLAPRLPCEIFPTLDDALDWCWRCSAPGDSIILSPGCASTDQFLNYRQRGERFNELVERLGNFPNRKSQP